MAPECALECECCSTVFKTTNQLGCSMNTAEVIFQMFVFDELLVAILFDTSKRLLKVVGSHHVLLQILFLSKLLCTTWLGASMRLFIVVHYFNVLSNVTLRTELFQALATLVWPLFIVDIFNVSLQVMFVPKHHFAVCDITRKDFLVLPFGLNVCLQTALHLAAPKFTNGRLVPAVHIVSMILGSLIILNEKHTLQSTLD